MNKPLQINITDYSIQTLRIKQNKTDNRTIPSIKRFLISPNHKTKITNDEIIFTIGLTRRFISPTRLSRIILIKELTIHPSFNFSAFLLELVPILKTYEKLEYLIIEGKLSSAQIDILTDNGFISPSQSLDKELEDNTNLFFNFTDAQIEENKNKIINNSPVELLLSINPFIKKETLAKLRITKIKLPSFALGS